MTILTKLVAAGFIAQLLVTPVYAVNGDKKVTDRPTILQDGKVIGCGVLVGRLNKAINFSKTHHTKMDALAEKVNTRYAAQLARLKKNGVDTTQLEADWATFKTKVEVARVSAKAAYDQAIVTQKLDCGHSEGAYKESYQKTIELAKKAKQDALSAIAFYRSTVKVDVQKLKASVQ